MGSISKLKDENINVHLFLSSSNLCELYVYDNLKALCAAGTDSIFTVNNRSTLDNMFELVNTQPFLAEKWFFVIEYGKIKKSIAGKQLLFRIDTSRFLVKVKNYKEYLEAKEYFAPISDVFNDIYLSFINFRDVEYLLRDFELSDKMLSFIYKSYSSDPEKVFILYNELTNGSIITTRKQVTDICGISTGTLNSFAISLLGNEPKGDRGKKTVIRNRVKSAVELAEVYGYGKLRNFLLASVRDILDIKTLYLEGVIYDRLDEIPELWVTDSKGEKSLVYDIGKLKRYKIYLETIKDIPYIRILRLYLMLKKWGRWSKDTDMINFIYQYYEKGEL